ncbi:MAG TPA: FAD-linked oxidase C-terminal domain-containing protein [Methylomirabilota bacterium]|jgi:glycolate oxidase|nr:FAD-linked oxidase C-terminal domain-containing protein [Methylomirabilota bacterium]
MALTPEVVAELMRIVGPGGLVLTAEGRMVYECDMHTFYKGAPDAVVLPARTEQVQEIVRMCRAAHVPIVPRGSGTGLIGGAMAPHGGVMVGMNRMAAVLEVDLPNRTATVQPGLINLWLSNAVREPGWFFAPDPSSQMVSSIGGNVSTNAGGPHCLKYGITTNHVLGLEMVTGSGDLVRLGGKTVDRPGYDLTGIAVGSEGTFGLVTAVTVRLTHLPEAVKTALASFRTVVDASETVSAIIASGMIPAALEMLDEAIIKAINAGTGAGYPEGAGAVLLIELDGPRAEVEVQAERAAAICRQRGALSVSVARDDAERALLWKGRKEAAGAVGRLTASYLLQDAVVPRSRLPQIMREMVAIGERYGLLIANVFHAGDGNLHPMICYDDRRPEELERAKEANEELLRACIALGGSVTGEHGNGLDKGKNLPLQYADADLNFMYRLRGVFDPDRMMNPGKLLPSHPACGEGFRPQRPVLPAGTWV